MTAPSRNDLRAIPLLAQLSATDLKLVARAVEERDYANRVTIFDEGAPCAGLYLLKTGQVKLLRACREKEQLVGILNPGEPLDLIPFLDNRPHSVTARARGRVSVYFIPFAAAHDLIWNTPALFSAVLSIVSMRLRDLATFATDLAFKDVTARVCDFLLEQARSQVKCESDGIHLPRNLSQSEFASLIGTSREVAWRSLKKLEHDGLIKIERHEITLLDTERLASLV